LPLRVATLSGRASAGVAARCSPSPQTTVSQINKRAGIFECSAARRHWPATCGYPNPGMVAQRERPV